MTTTTVKQLTPLFDNMVLGRLERLRLNPVRRQTNKNTGEHLSGKGGTSTEFSDYRDYSHGDDMRYVDWNIFSRLNRPFVKQYRHEEEMHVVVIVDASSSMMFEGKFWKAKQLAGAFSVMALLGFERLSIYSCNHLGAQPNLLPPCAGRMSMKRVFDFLQDIEGGGDFPIEQAVEAVLRRHRGKGIAVLLSDFLTFGDLSRPMNFLYSAGLEVFAVQILAPSEIEPEITGDVRFVDCETGETLDISSAGDLLSIYQDHREGLANYIGAMCRQRSGRFLSIGSRDELGTVLFDVMRRRGWVR
ncbi:MAG: DUF58 domain-containing protein [Planctomycetaceae bacterium]